MSLLVTVIFLIVGLANFLPAVGAVSAARIGRLYGVEPTDPNLVVLLRHRAVLFGLLGAFILIAAFRPSLQYLAGAAGLISMLSFVLLAPLPAPLSDEIRKVRKVDVVASAVLAAGLALKAFA